ncbi:uncharacterized protein LOC144768008 [Lissotriton helveticus]
MNEDRQVMEVPLLARVVLTLAVVAATTAAVRWLVSGQRKKARTASDAERLEVCLGRQSLADSRAQGIGSQLWEEGPALCHPQLLEGNATSTQASHGRSGTEVPGSAIQGTGSAPAWHLTSRDQATWHLLEADPPTTGNAISLCPKTEPGAAGESEAPAGEMPPGCTARSQLEATLGAFMPSPAGSLGQTSVPKQPPDATLPGNPNDPSQVGSLFVASALAVHAERGQGIDGTETGGHGDKRNCLIFGNRYRPATDRAREPDTGSEAAAASGGYEPRWEESRACQGRGRPGESGPAGCVPTERHPGTPVPPLPPDNEGEEAPLGWHAKPLNSVPSETGARESQHPPEARPGEGTHQTMEAASDFTMSAGEIDASDGLRDPAGGNPGTCSEKGTGHAGVGSGPGCEERAGCEHSASLTVTHELRDPGTPAPEPCPGRGPSTHPNRRLSREGPPALPAECGHSPAERGHLHAEWASSEGCSKKTQQHEDTCLSKALEARACGEGSEDDLSTCHEKDEHSCADEQARAVSLRLPSVPSGPHQFRARSKESQPCHGGTTNPTRSGLRVEGGSAEIHTQSGYQTANQGRTQLEVETHGSSDHDATTTKMDLEWMNVDAKLGLKLLLETKSVQDEFSLCEKSDCSHEVKGQASMEPHVGSKGREVVTQMSTLDDTPDCHKYSNNKHTPAPKCTSNHTSKYTNNTLGESDFQMGKSHTNTSSDVQVNAGHLWKEPAVYTPFRRDATKSLGQTQEKEQLQTDSAGFELRLQNTILNNNNLPSGVTKAFGNGRTYQVSLSEGDRNDSKSSSREQGLKHIVKNESSCSDEFPFPDSSLSKEIEEQGLSASYDSHTRCDVTGHPSMVYPSVRETSQYAPANVLLLPPPTAVSSMVEKFTYEPTSPLVEVSSSSVTNIKAKHDSKQRDDDMMDRDLNTSISSPGTPRLHCEGLSVSATTDVKVSTNEPPVQKTIEDNESVVGSQGTLELREARQYKEHYPTDLPKCDTSDDQVCKRQPGKESALGETEAMLDPSQGWNADHEIYQEKENNEDSVIESENGNDSKSSFKSELRAQDANQNTQHCVPEKETRGRHILSFPNELVPLVSEPVTTTESSSPFINHNVESIKSTFQENAECPDNLGTAILMDFKVNELHPSHVRNKGHNAKDQLSLQDASTLGPSNDMKHNLLLPSSNISKRPGVGEGNNAGHYQKQERISSNEAVSCQLDGTDMVMDIKEILSSEIKKASVAKIHKEGSCHSAREQLFGSSYIEGGNDVTLLLHGIREDITNEAADEDSPKTQMLQEPEDTLQNNKTADPVDQCVSKVEKTQQCEARSSCIQDVYTGSKDFSELKMPPHEYLCSEKQPRPADSKNNLDSETSDSGYTTDSICTPVHEERSWSSLGVEDEELEANNHDLEPIIPDMEQTRDTAYHRENNTASAAVNYKRINRKDSISAEGKPEEKNRVSTEGSQSPSVKPGVTVCDNLFSSTTNVCVMEIAHKHIGLVSDHLQQSFKDNVENFRRGDKQSCKSPCPEKCGTCSDTDKSRGSDNTMLNVSSHQVKRSEAKDPCHKLHEQWLPSNTAEDPEQTAGGEATHFIQGLMGIDTNKEDEEALTDSDFSIHFSADSIPVETSAESVGTITAFQHKLGDAHQALHFEVIESNKQPEKEEHNSSVDLCCDCSEPQKESIYEWKFTRQPQDRKAITCTTKISSGSYEGVLKAKAESPSLLQSGQESHNVSRLPSRSTPDDAKGSLTFSENEHSKSNKSQSIPGTHPDGSSQTKVQATRTLDAVFGENDYAHRTRHKEIPRTVSLPNTAFHETHSPSLITPFEPSNSNSSMDRPRVGEQQTASHKDHAVSSINAPVELERKMHQRRKGIQRRGSISEIAENPELRIYDTECSNPKTKMPLAKSCEDILSGAPNKKVDAKNKARSMLCLLTEHYSLPASKDQKSPVELVAKGSFLNIPETLQLTEDAMKLQLNLGNCLELLKFAKKNRAGDLQEAAYAVMSDNYLQVLRDPSIYGHLNGGERDRILQLRTRGKNVLGVAELETIYRLKNIRQSSSCPAVNDLSPHSQGTGLQPHAWLYTFDMLKNVWQPLTQIPAEANLKGCSICTLNNYLFLAGGIREQGQDAICSNKVFCYNPLTEIWRQVMPMNQARSQLKLVPVDGYLYAIGGECLYTVERYDPRLDKWTFRASLPKGLFAVAHEAVTCNGEIYVSGGNLFYRLLKYSPLKDLWEECPYNNSRKRSCDMVAIRNFIYRFDIHRESGVSVFKYNTTAKIWNECATMCLSNMLPFRCAVLDGAVYCLNKKMTVRFSADDRSQRFEPESLCAFPGGGGGALCPFVLTLPHHTSFQTSV